MRSEAITLELSELDLEAGMLRARGKGSKERLVPIGCKAVETLTVYLEQGRPRLVGIRDEPHVFVNLRGARPVAPGPVPDRPEPRPQRRPGAAA